MSKGEVLNARDNTLALVRRCMEGVGYAAPVAICCDLGKSFRKDLFPEYKANRPEKDLMALAELDKTRETLANEGFVIWGAGGFEADDVIATATKMALAAGHPVRVASADKDLLQLLAFDRVTVLRTHDMSLWRKEDVISKFGVPPYLLGDWLALTGDDSDNIAGVPGVGEKTATAFLTAFPGLGFLLDAAATGAAAKCAVRGAERLAKAIHQNAEAVRLWRKLVELRFDAALPFDEIFTPRERKRPADQPEQENDMEAGNEMSAGNDMGPPPISAPPGTSEKPAEKPPEATPAAPGSAPAETKQIAVRQVLVPEVVLPFEMGLEPVNAVQARSMATVLWRSGLYAKKFPGEEAIYAVITRGRELGVGALASLDVFHFFEGQLALHAHFIRHLAQNDPDCEWFLPCPAEGDDKTKIARWGTKHRRIDQPIFHTYTIQDAVDAGLCELEVKARDWTLDPKTGKPDKDHRGNWDKRRPEMLDKTCSSQLARRVYPGRALGLYSLAELGGDEA